MIEGVEVKELVTHADERGFFREIIRETDPFFDHFGQWSHSLMYPGTAKAWHIHQEQTDWWYAIGSLKVALYDLRPARQPRASWWRSSWATASPLREDPARRRARLPRPRAEPPPLRHLEGLQPGRRRPPAARRRRDRLRLDGVAEDHLTERKLRRLLVAGAAGFIGSHFVKLLRRTRPRSRSSSSTS